jgi:UDP-N-acetyl-D-glucosamine dehydrogenase
MKKESSRYSASPSGEKFMVPEKQDYEKELKRIKELVIRARKDNKEIVVVMGLGFVGAVMAAIVADTKDKKGRHSKFVIGCQRPSVRSYWKIPMITRG